MTRVPESPLVRLETPAPTTGAVPTATWEVLRNEAKSTTLEHT